VRETEANAPVSESPPTLWELDPDLFAAPTAQVRDDSYYHSLAFDAQYRRERARKRVRFARLRLPQETETVADPEEVSSTRRKAAEARDKYFGAPEPKQRRGDPRLALPESGDLRALADTFGASAEALAQAEEMERRGLRGKAKRLALCGRIGHRVNCTENSEHRFLQSYMCRCRYCATCGPSWFRQQYTDLLLTLETVIKHLLDEGRKRGRDTVIAKLDFTVLNTGTMPGSEKVRQFHREMHDFWRLAERIFGIGRKEYGHAGCDEFGGGNTNLHRHSVYVGPVLPQRHRELSALWSIAGLRGERRREMLRFVRKYGPRGAWSALRSWERRFVSIKRARSFRAALAHALKYPAKFLSASTPERLAELEAAFHKTRRFSAGGAFYNVKPMREPGEDSPTGSCPHCGARLMEVSDPGWVPRFVLESEGRRDLETVRREVNRAKILSGSGPP
jgi:hypothetical protein